MELLKMAVLENQCNSNTSKIEKFEQHEGFGKKSDGHDPFADCRGGGKFLELKEEKEKALAILKDKKVLPDTIIDGLEHDNGGKGKPNGGKVKGGKGDWLDCIKPGPEATGDGLTFDPNKVPHDGGMKDVKKPNLDGGVKEQKKPNVDGGITEMKVKSSSDGGTKAAPQELLL
jgi:hypothetical protein